MPQLATLFHVTRLKTDLQRDIQVSAAQASAGATHVLTNCHPGRVFSGWGGGELMLLSQSLHLQSHHSQVTEIVFANEDQSLGPGHRAQALIVRRLCRYLSGAATQPTGLEAPSYLCRASFLFQGSCRRWQSLQSSEGLQQHLQEYLGATSSDITRHFRNADPDLHPFERAREYQRALKARRLF